MSLLTTILLTGQLVSLVFLIQGIEMYFVSTKTSFLRIWSYKNLKNDLERGLPLPNGLISFIFSINGFRAVIFLQIICATIGIFYSDLFLFFVLFIMNLLINIRFRGNFNGGSDMMNFVLLTGMIISLSTSSENIQKLGFIYISIHTLFSYIKAGWTKIIQQDWQKGIAIQAFLKRSPYMDIRILGNKLEQNFRISKILSWAVIAFELSAILLLIFPTFMDFYFFAAFIFHLSIYLMFGLNRFFWSWIAAWPPIFYTLSLLPYS